MPEGPFKSRPHPAKAGASPPTPRRATVEYAELAVTTNFTFLTGASHPDELAVRAAELGHTALAVTDTHTLAGIVRAHVAATHAGIPLVVGCRLLIDPSHADAPRSPVELLIYPTDLASYGRLCTLLTKLKTAATLHTACSLPDLSAASTGLLAAAVAPDSPDDVFAQTLSLLRDIFDDDRLSLAAAAVYGPDDRTRLDQIAALAARTQAPLLAINDVHYHVPQRRPLQDVLTCIRHGCTIADAGRRLLPNAERHLKAPEEMARLFAAYPLAIRRSVEVARRAAGFTLDQLRYQYPHEVCPAGVSPIQHLRQLCDSGAADRYPAGVPDKVRRQLDHELALIDELRYAPYFLTVHDLVRFARSRGILCQGRGAAANSAVCFCLGVTSVDPSRIDVLFERFVSRERNEPPDIDIDFEHERREEVLQYIYAKYSRRRAALTAEVITYRGRLAVREVGKALGLSADCVDRLAKMQDWWDDQPLGDDLLARAGLSHRDRTVAQLVDRTNELIGFPRHLSQHVGGFVITHDPLCELVPIIAAAMPDRTLIEWDKDDIDALGILKVDCLGLGMLTCIRKCFDLVARHHRRPLTLATVPPEDPAVYDRICLADTVGVFQIESRAQMSMLPRLRPRRFYDLVIQVGIVRPGPIVGKMVHPYLRRRQGMEPVEYPDDKVRAVLEKTLGIPLFQEQAMRLAMVAGGFSSEQAERFRRAIGSWRKHERLEAITRELADGMIANGYPPAFAAQCIEQFHGFSHYGFPESHAASFALLVYVSAWLKCHYPAAFAAALLNSQPMGFYAPAQIVADAQRHGVPVRPVDTNRSGWDCRLEHADDAAASPQRDATSPAIRLGMRMVRGLNHDDALAIERAVDHRGPFATVESLHRATGVRVASLRALAAADAFGSMHLDRQAALWQIRAIRDDDMPLFAEPAVAICGPRFEIAPLPPVSEYQKVLHDYHAAGVSLRGHPIGFLRDWLTGRRVITAAALRDPRQTPLGRLVRVAGVVLVRQRPSSAAGVIFITLEDETGSTNAMIRPAILPRVKAALAGNAVICSGKVERNGDVVHVLITDIENITDRLRDLSLASRNFR